MKRVVVTGMSGITSLGEDFDTIYAAMLAGKNGIVRMDSWDAFAELNTRLGGPVQGFTVPAHFNRKSTRSMGRVALMATVAAERALIQSGLHGQEIIKNGRTGVAFGSSAGSVDAVMEFGAMLLHSNSSRVNATTYIRMMSHTTAVNLSVYLGLKGVTLPTSSACTSGSMGIGQAYEAIKYGRQTVMLAGGAEELSPTGAAVFDVMYATSRLNDTPHLSPRPFDQSRDGLVIGEGAGCLILEELEHARARGATIYAEVMGYASNTDGTHVTKPEQATMARCMQLCLDDAAIAPEQIGYVSAHATATDQGDIAESHATFEVLGVKPVNSLKSYFGHTLGACGALEAWLGIEMLNRDEYIPTLNLQHIDPLCAPLDYIQHAPRHISSEFFMSNNFAFGGINTSLIFRRASAV